MDLKEQMHRDKLELMQKLCSIHADVSAIKTKQDSQDKCINANKKKADANEKFIDRIKGGLVLVSCSGIIGLIVKFYMLGN